MRGVYGFALVLRDYSFFFSKLLPAVMFVVVILFLDYPHISWIDFDYIGNHALDINKNKQ